MKLIPPFLRKDKLIHLLFAFISPLNTIKTAFNNQINQTNYKLQFNGQIIYLEHYLNDFYDPVNRGVYIQDVANVEYKYLFNKLEQRSPFYVFNKSENQPVYLKNQQEYDLQIHFIVKVPLGVVYNNLKMRKEIDYYKIAEKKYEIQTY